MAILKQLDDTPLAFGKYKGKTPNEVAEINPGYIVWMYENIERENCTHRLYKECGAQQISQARAYIYTDYEYEHNADYDREDDIGDGSWSGHGWGNDS